MSNIDVNKEKAYLDSVGAGEDAACPFCMDTSITRDPSTFDLLNASIDVSCGKCGETWSECYQLVGLT